MEARAGGNRRNRRRGRIPDRGRRRETVHRIKEETEDNFRRKRRRRSANIDYRVVETEGLIKEYQKNAKPTQSDIRLLEFYGGEDWRTNEGNNE